MHVHQMDVIAAYVQGDLKEEVYMEQSELFINPKETNNVCRLRKPLYDLKQAGRAWYTKLNNFLLNINMERSKMNSCLYVNSAKENRIIIVIYVDDLLIASRNL